MQEGHSDQDHQQDSSGSAPWFRNKVVQTVIIVLAVLAVLGVLYFAGRGLIERDQEADQGGGETVQTLQDCTDDTVYRSLDAALSNRDEACYLDLSGQNMSSLSGSIGYLTRLKEFDISDNVLSDVPSQFSYMRGLEVMDFSNNQLAEIPGQIGYLTKLKRVDWSGNNLTSIPVQISYMREIEVFDLSDNQLTEIPEHIGYFSQLKVLDLRNNNLSALPQRIDNLRSLERLELGGNPLPPHEIDRVKQVLPWAEVRVVAAGQ